MNNNVKCSTTRKRNTTSRMSLKRRMCERLCSLVSKKSIARHQLCCIESFDREKRFIHWLLTRRKANLIEVVFAIIRLYWYGGKLKVHTPIHALRHHTQTLSIFFLATRTTGNNILSLSLFHSPNRGGKIAVCVVIVRKRHYWAILFFYILSDFPIPDNFQDFRLALL